MEVNDPVTHYVSVFRAGVFTGAHCSRWMRRDGAQIFGASPSESVLEVIEKVKRRYSEATAALDDCDREQRLSPGGRPTFLVSRRG